MTYWVEIRPWQSRVGPPDLVKLDDLQHTQFLGFRSVYAYPDKVMQTIKQTRSTAGLEWASVYSDTLFVDFDNCDDAALGFLLWLYDERYAHTAYLSGNRSVHVHLPIEPMEGPWVPYSQRAWVAREVPHADLSFYTHAGQFRLPGTRHEKTGRRKTLERELRGRRLEIPRTDKPEHTATAAGKPTGEFFSRLLRTKGEGERRVYVWHLAKMALSEGYTFDQAVAKIQWWNMRRCVPQLPADTVREKILEVYRT